MNYKKALEKEQLLRQEILLKQQQHQQEQQQQNEQPVDKDSINIEPARENGCPFMHNGSDAIQINEVSNGNDISAADTMASESNVNVSKPGDALGTLTTAKIETVTENLKAQSLTVQQITDYCKSLFIFKNIRVMRFK